MPVFVAVCDADFSSEILYFQN